MQTESEPTVNELDVILGKRLVEVALSSDSPLATSMLNLLLTVGGLEQAVRSDADLVARTSASLIASGGEAAIYGGTLTMYVAEHSRRDAVLLWRRLEEQSPQLAGEAASDIEARVELESASSSANVGRLAVWRDYFDSVASDSL